MNRTICAFFLSLMTLVAVAFCSKATNAAVVTDPALATGPDSIDPLAPDANAGAIDATGLVTGAVTKADLTLTTDFSVVQNFTGFGAQQVNYFDFTDPARPDVRFVTSAGNGSAGANTVNGASSGNSAMYLGSGPLGWGQTIEFGSYDSGINSFTADRSVSATGFMLTRLSEFGAGNARWTATFRDDANQVLSTQQIVTSGASAAHLFGYVSPSANIRRIELVFDQVQVNTFLDDFGFTTGPPPAVNPFAKVPALNNFNGSFEETSAGAGAPTSNLNGSNGSFDAFDANFLDINGWDPYFEDPNNVVGRYGPAGFLTTNSFYLDTLSGSGGGSDGSRRLTLNSVDGYVNGIVNENVLAGIDSRFLNPNVQLKIVVDVARGATSIAGNTNATATLALTDGVGAAATDLTNAIASASVQQSLLGLNNLQSGGTQLELSLTGADLAAATQLNLLVQSVNTNPTTGETAVGRDSQIGSQAFFDNLRILAFLPGDADGDFDVDGDDLTAWQTNYGGNDLSFAEGDFDLDGDADGSDFLIWQRNFTGSLPPLLSSVAAVPEPASAALLLVGVCMFNSRRKG